MRYKLALAMGIALLLGPAVALADAPRELIRQGNEHFAAGRFAEALKCYQQAEAGAAQPSAELLHDLAAAHFKLGQIDEARDLWVRAKAAPDAAFEARSRYNLGNCAYTEALGLAGQKGAQALAKLAEAAEQYQAAVRLDPTLSNARANLELTQLLKRQIEEQQQKQPQSQPSTSPSQQDQKDKQQQSSTQPSQADQKDQSKQNEQQKQDQSAATQPAQQPESQPSQEDQQQDQEQQKPPDKQQASETQPSEVPETMPVESQPAEGDETGKESPTIRLSREQAERLLQMIRDAEKARREKTAAQRVAKQKPVERDW